MCARFTLRQIADLPERFQAALPLGEAPPPRFNVAPSTDVPIVVENAGTRQIELARWGLVPGWAKDASIGQKLINARGETLADKPSFRNALKSRRCLIPMDGFFEWRAVRDATGKTRKQPIFVHRRDDALFAVAGLYETWRDPAGQTLTSCTLVTTQPNALMTGIHDRMPALLRPEDEAAWLAPTLPDHWPALLAPYPDTWLAAYPVSTAVNRPGTELPTLLEPVGEPLVAAP
jgi:putative SOS response-associated peptidase YedK